MNEKSVIDCLNSANQDDTVNIYVHSKPYSYDNKYINYWSYGHNLCVLDRKYFLRHIINLNSIKSIKIVNNIELDKLKHLELQDYIRNNNNNNVRCL